MVNLKKLSLICLLIFCLSLPAQAEVKLEILLTCEGLTNQGFPASYKKTFSLNQDRGVQYYVAWQNDNKSRRVTVKWFDPKGQLISRLILNNFSKGIVRDYISFSKLSKTQYFIPIRTGVYTVYLYIDQNLKAVTEFKVVD